MYIFSTGEPIYINRSCALTLQGNFMADRNNKVITALLAIAIVFVVGVFVYYEWWPEREDKEDVISIFYSGLEWSYTLENLKTLESYTGRGGMRTEIGVKGPDNYTGVSIEAILDDIGLPANSDIEMTLTAIDNYSKTINTSVVHGHMVQYDQNGSSIESDTVPVLILAYMENGEYIGDTDGPIRVAFVAPEPVYTNSKYWIKQVIRIDILLI
jgi:hypothetical protein